MVISSGGLVHAPCRIPYRRHRGVGCRQRGGRWPVRGLAAVPWAGSVVAGNPALPPAWSPTENVAWKPRRSRPGWSSPVVWGDHVFVTGVVSSERTEPPQGASTSAVTAEPRRQTHRWMVYCSTSHRQGPLGAECVKAAARRTIHVKNSYASETPVTDGERVYVYFGNVGLFAFDLDGKAVWSKEMVGVEDAQRAGAPAASPVLHEGGCTSSTTTRRVVPRRPRQQTGQGVWRVDRDEKSNWATPFVWENERRTEIVTPGTGKVRSYDLDGKLLWELAGMSSITIPTPFARHGLLYVSSGYVGDAPRPVYAIRPGASGDITLKTARRATSSSPGPAAGRAVPPVAAGPRRLPIRCSTAASSLLRRQDRQGGLRQAAHLAERAASPRRRGPTTASLRLSEDGDTFVMQAGPEFKVLGKNTLDEMTLATPASSRGSLSSGRRRSCTASQEAAHRPRE